MSDPTPARCPRWARLALLTILIFDIWLRGHTFGPTLRTRYGFNLWPVTGAEAEPLDCDESAYAYIGRRIVRGDVLYRDLTENKPPGGYWLYALTVALGGAEELTIRVMPIPFILVTIVLVWWLALRLCGPGAACLAALVFAVASTDPYLFGNGANMEHFLNFFSVASLAALIWTWHRPGRAGLCVAGVFLGAACLVKQVAVVHGAVSAAALLLRRHVSSTQVARPTASRIKDVLVLGGGAALVGLVAVLIVDAQGAGPAAFEDVVRYGGALAADTPPDPHAPPRWVRWVTGNADPRNGRLPWPFGPTDYLVWWGTGTWPLWLAAVPAVGWLPCGRGTTGPRKLAAAWTLSAWVQVALPGLFWQHYYLLPVPGLALAVAIFLVDSLVFIRSDRPRRVLWVIVASGLCLSLAWTARIQLRDYLLVPPEQLTVRSKGGRQWVELRKLGRELARCSTVWPRPLLYNWGWQSPLLIYSGLESASRHFFVDELLKTVGSRDGQSLRPPTRRLLETRAEEILGDLRARPPALILVGHPPFPGLIRFLNARYLPSHLVRLGPEGEGLWVERSRYGEFEKCVP